MVKLKLFILSVFGIFLLTGCALTPPVVESTPAGSENNQLNLNENVNNNQINYMTNNIAVKQAIISTNLGDITIEFYPESPNTVANFVKLARADFYDGVRFHRVIKGFMLQTGDPNSKDDDWSNDGIGGPGYSFADEINQHKLVRGSVAMANAGPDTNGSQFFIVTAPATPWLDGKHTNFGYVSKGLDVIDKIETAQTNENDHPLQNITINKITIN